LFPLFREIFFARFKKRFLLAHVKASFDQAKMKNMLKRRFLIDQSFAVSGGITGQIDFWPNGLCHESQYAQCLEEFFHLGKNKCWKLIVQS